MPAPDPSPPLVASRRTILRNFAGVAGIGVVSRLIGIFLNVYTRRTMGPTVVGMAEWNAAVLSYASLAANPGLQTVARRDAARSPARAAELLIGTTLLQLGPAILVLAVCAASKAAGVRTGLAGSLLVLQAFGSVLAAVQARWIFEAVDRHILVNVVALASLVTTGVATVLLVRDPDDALRLFAIQVGGNAMASALSLGLAFRERLLTPASVWAALGRAFEGLPRLYWDAVPLTLAGLAVTLYSNGVTLVLGPTYGDAAVGLYTTAASLVAFGTVAATALSSVYFSSLARSFAADAGGGAAPAVSFDFFRAVFLTTAPSGLLGWAVGRHALTLVYGPAYAAVGPYFEWLCLYLVLVGLNIGMAHPLTPWGRHALLLRITALGAAVNVAINLTVVPRYGVAGAVVTTVATEAVLVFVLLRVRARLVPLPYGRTLASLVPMVAIAGATRWSVQVWPAYWIALLLIAALGMGGVIAAFNWPLATRVLRVMRHR